MKIDLGSELAKFLNFNIAEVPNRLDYETVRVAERELYREVLIKYRSNEGDFIPAFLLLPKKPNGAAILIHHQHNGERHLGKSEVVGLAGNSLQAFGPALANRGITVLVPDSICFEDRRPNARGIERDEEGDFLQHFNEMTYRLIKGDTLMKKVLDDASAGLSVLLSLEGIDHNHVGVFGHSYGGNTTLFQAALDQRVKFACSSGAICSYKNKMERRTGLEFSLAIPNIFNQFDLVEVLSAVAPRKFLVVSADEDKYSQDADEIVDECHRRLGSIASTLQHFRFKGGHSLTSERFDKIVAWLAEKD